jgi:hypothetical protein
VKEGDYTTFSFSKGHHGADGTVMQAIPMIWLAVVSCPDTEKALVLGSPEALR